MKQAQISWEVECKILFHIQTPRHTGPRGLIAVGWEHCPAGRPASQFGTCSMPARSLSAWDLPLASIVPTAQPHGMPGLSSCPQPLKPQPGKLSPTAPGQGFPRPHQWLLHSATGSSAGPDSACFAELFPGSCLCLYRVGLPQAQSPGPAPLPLGDASQASALISKFKNPLSACQSHTGVQQSSSNFTWPKWMEFPLKYLPCTPNPRPNSSPNSSCQMLRSKPQELS